MKILNDLSTVLIFSLLVILGVRNLKNEIDTFSFISLVILVLFLLIKLVVIMRRKNE
jgi:amino acid transporter